MTAEELARNGLILQGVVGSTAHGLSLDDQDDRDLMGVCIEPPEYVMGLKQFETYTWRTQPEGARSGPGDVDLTIHSLRKFCRLAAKGNPTILALLFLPDYEVFPWAGRELVWRRDLFYSKHAGRAFLGYMTQQRERLTGERGQKRTNRPELIEAHGFDTKYAGHVLRLGYQGVEYMSTGSMTLPMRTAERLTVLKCRRGEYSLDVVLREALDLEAQLESLLDDDSIRPEPDYAGINRLLVRLHALEWGYQ